MPLFGLFSSRRHERAGFKLYTASVQAARDPVYFERLGVPDTLDGRFDLVGLFAALTIRRLRQLPAPGVALAQAVFDAMFADMDFTLREIGVGEMSVGKKIRVMWEAFHGRALAYETPLGSGDAAAMAAALGRNVWRGAAPAGAAEGLARVALAQDRCLAGQNIGEFGRGNSVFVRGRGVGRCCGAAGGGLMREGFEGAAEGVVPEVQRTFSVGKVGDGARVVVEASAAECRALAGRMGLVAVHSLDCRFDLRREVGDCVAAAGLLRARVVQSCVVSLEAFEAEVVESFSVRFVPAGTERDDLDLESDDEVPYAGGVLELGEAACEQLALALDPFPRRPGAELEEVAEESEGGAFAGLGKLLPRQ